MTSFLLFLLLHSGRVIARPVQEPTATSTVRQVMPASGPVHENLLRFSIRFSEPPKGAVLPKLRLVRIDGSTIDEPFLNQELWSPDGRILTVILGPGRVKTGLIAHDTLGRPLHAGENVLLEMGGQPIARWKVTQEMIRPIDPRTWHVEEPEVTSKNPLALRFGSSIDGMDSSMIVIVRDGRKVAGRSELSADQREWSFRPAGRWESGRYDILIHPHLEDPYGNEVGSAFETPISGSQHSERQPADIPFLVR